MALTPGQQAGPYEVIAPIGSGGMGEVYRARDLKLKRDVVLKILPAIKRPPGRKASSWSGGSSIHINDVALGSDSPEPER